MPNASASISCATSRRRRRTASPTPVSVIAAPPDLDALETLIDVAFWTSLRREEGYVPIISLALLSPEETPSALRFAEPLLLKPATLAKVAPAVERPGVHLGVSPIDGKLVVWGATRLLPAFCLVLEVAAPGLLVIKQHRGGEHTKFANIAVLEADQVKIVDEDASGLPDCPSLLSSLLGFDTPRVVDRFGQRSRPAVGVDAGAQARRFVAGRPRGLGSVARVDRVADRL